MILAFSLGFMARHPGLLLVFIGVAGEVICDWKEMSGRLSWAKKFSAILLVLGLTIEFIEAAKSDKDVADTKARAAFAENEAGQANERAANVESNNVVLSFTIEGLRSNNLAVERQVENLRKENLLLETKMINGLYLRAVVETFRLDDISRVTVQKLGMSNTRIFLKLQNVPVPNSLQATLQFHPGLIRGILGLIVGLPYNKEMSAFLTNNKNIAFAKITIPRWDTLEYPGSPVILVKYTKMEQETNLFNKVEIKGKDVFFDNVKEILN